MVHDVRMASSRREGKSVDEFLNPKRRVFLVHGRDDRTRQAMVAFLNALDLRVVTWSEAVQHTGLGTPYTGDVVIAGMELSDVVVVLLTPDDEGRIREAFLEPRDGTEERDLTGQPRMNVIFEAGIAMGRERSKTILVEVGAVRPMSDAEGLNVVRLKHGSSKARHSLAKRLSAAGLAVDTNSGEWLSAGDFA